jgi:hypothetical protein
VKAKIIQDLIPTAPTGLCGSGRTMLPPENESTFARKRDIKMNVKEKDDETKEIQELILRNPLYESMKYVKFRISALFR